MYRRMALTDMWTMAHRTADQEAQLTNESPRNL